MLTSAFQIPPLPHVSKRQHSRYPSPLKSADVLYGWPLNRYCEEPIPVIFFKNSSDVNSLEAAALLGGIFLWNHHATLKSSFFLSTEWNDGFHMALNNGCLQVKTFWFQIICNFSKFLKPDTNASVHHVTMPWQLGREKLTQLRSN